MSLAVFGHTNPDTDAITSALVYAHLLNESGIAAVPYRLGEPNNETRFVLEKAALPLPSLLESLETGTSVALVDHNETGQSLMGLTDLVVTHVIDHHKLGDLTTDAPAYLRFEPVGCTATILFALYNEKNISIPSVYALLMLSAILSDTLHFRSPTTTAQDRSAAEALAQIAGIADIEAYALQMFAAKSDLGDIAPEKLLTMDYKLFPFGKQTWGIGVIETTNPQYVLGRKQELLEVMTLTKTRDQLGGILLSVIDILNETNQTFILSETEETLVNDVFQASTTDYIADLGNRISRKKQIIPAIESYFAQ